MVDRALQEKQQKIVQAEGEATAAQMLGEAISKNPGYLKLRKLRASGNIAKTVSRVPVDMLQLLYQLVVPEGNVWQFELKVDTWVANSSTSPRFNSFEFGVAVCRSRTRRTASTFTRAPSCSTSTTTTTTRPSRASRPKSSPVLSYTAQVFWGRNLGEH